jgi:DNA-binding transcriptional LysR family regulator
MYDITDWQVFVRAAELNNLSAAGRDLRMSSAVVSNRIAKLEKQLGARLLNRTTRRVSLTPEGELFYRRAIDILREIEDLREAVSARQASPSGPLTIAAPAGFGRRHVAPFMPEFVEQYPDIQIRLRLSDHLSDLVADGADIAIRIADLKNMSFIARKLADNKRALVASPDYLARHGVPESPENLLDHACLLLRFPGSQQFQWQLKGESRSVTLPVTGSLDSDDGETLLNWCLDGAGIALRSFWEISDLLAENKLVQVLPDWQPPSHAIYAVYPHSRLLPPRARAFIDFLAALYKPQPYWETDKPPAGARAGGHTDK